MEETKSLSWLRKPPQYLLRRQFWDGRFSAPPDASPTLWSQGRRLPHSVLGRLPSLLATTPRCSVECQGAGIGRGPYKTLVNWVLLGAGKRYGPNLGMWMHVPSCAETSPARG